MNNVTFRDICAPVDFSGKNFGVTTEGNISTDHVEKKNSERPDGSLDSQITSVTDPFRRAVHASSCKRFV